VSGPCQVDFYVLGSPTQRPEKLACRLALMAWERGHEVIVVTEGEMAAAELDDLMWKWPAGRFLPHGRAGADEARGAPVTILSQPPSPRGAAGESDVVINLTARALGGPLPFRRLLEIVPHDPDLREASRDKFRHYRSRGLQPRMHEIS
jgi:DNA polymerase-3 subunit chi